MITKFKCNSFKRYKAVRKPKCGCLACLLKYTFRRGKPARRAAEPTVTKADMLDAQREYEQGR